MTQKPVKKKKRRRRKLRKGVVVFLAVLAVAAGLLFYIPRQLTVSKLKSLGYTSEQVRMIRKMELQDVIIKNRYYSENLAEAVENGTVNTDYLPLYTAVNRTLDEDDFLLYNRLMDHEYEEDQVQNLFASLSFREMIPLLLYDYQWDETPYIEDCKNNRDTNTGGTFILTKNYGTPYRVTEEIGMPSSVSALINSHMYLPEDYVPEKLTDIDTQYAITGQQLRDDAAEAFEKLCAAAQENGTPCYAVNTYRSWEFQNNAYKSFSDSLGEEGADKKCIRPGHSEHQAGLAVNIAATYEGDKAFEETELYKWLVTNAAEYGWILRYPLPLSGITTIADEPDHLRYLGKDLAKAVKASNLTYDEYYLLYLDSWHDENMKPSAEILKAVDYKRQNKKAGDEESEKPQETETPEETAEPVQSGETTETEAAPETEEPASEEVTSEEETSEEEASEAETEGSETEEN
ncbi:MAG: M15 family metallopeptidase [Solobacterium sp.]|nr:M15 family metallopeptidase [Solobacterium sp.]